MAVSNPRWNMMGLTSMVVLWLGSNGPTNLLFCNIGKALSHVSSNLNLNFLHICIYI